MHPFSMIGFCGVATFLMARAWIDGDGVCIEIVKIKNKTVLKSFVMFSPFLFYRLVFL